MKKKKKTGLIALCIILILILGGILFMNNYIKNIKSMSAAMPDLSYAADGEYTGEFTVAPVYVKVGVTIKDSGLAGVEILKHHNGLGSSAESIVNRIMEYQSLDVDAVSGATVSSKCILKAVENAMENAVKKQQAHE